MNVFDDAAARYPDKVALREKRDGATTWTELTYKEYHAQVLRMARALVKIGVRAHSGVAILGFNSFEWFIADLAAIYAGAMAAGIYTTNGPEACHYIVEHCDAEVCFVQNEAQLKKILEVRDRLPALKAIVVWQGELPADMDDSVMTWEQMIALGDDESLEAPLTERIAAQEPGHCCTLIYTSGTTGNPKAVMITHDNVTWTARTTSNVLEIDNDSQIISYLPLSHIAAQMVDIHAPLVSCGTVSFARPDALKGTLGDTLKEVRPTVFLGVPRVWEKIGDKMKAIGAKTTGLKKTISTWAKKKGLEGGYADQQGKSKGMMFGLANSLVFSKVKAGLGLDRCKIQCTAAAPISVETLEYFLQLNIPIYEVYGMSECTGPQTVSYPKNYKTGSCGKSLTGTRLELADKDAEGNGEICFRGRHIFAGYLKNPEATGQTIDGNGFLHSGDVGALDGGGFLKITGRIKELIITAGGENVPPVLIENSIKAEAPFISNVMVIGDKRKFLSCVITLHTEVDEEGEPTETLAGATKAKLKELGLELTTVADAQGSDKFKEAITAAIKAANANAASNAQKVQKFEILPVDFSVTGGELTATQKLKRRIVSSKYAEVIEGMYA
jgi:long-chain-fatty-acid--CoA ligase ACSBG